MNQKPTKSETYIYMIDWKIGSGLVKNGNKIQKLHQITSMTMRMPDRSLSSRISLIPSKL